jgi:citrate synthase
MELSKDLHERSTLPQSAVDTILNFSPNLHPMTQFSAGILALQEESLYAKAYRNGVHKKDYWDTTFEDTLNVIAKVPRVAALIYRNLYRKDSKALIEPNKDLDCKIK